MSTARGHLPFFAIPGKDKNDPNRAIAETMNGTPCWRIAFSDGQLYVPNRPESRAAGSGILPERHGS